MSGNRLTFSATLDDKVSKGLTLIEKRFKQAGTQASFLGNVGAMAVSKGFSLIDRAISSTIGFLGDAVAAGIAEEQSISKLGTALQANVRAWDGNTDAIEETLKARMALGFSDDEQRESLALLVAATGDATRALDIQRTAMDLARLKGISLADASNALIKVEAGQFRILKSLGIQLPKNATAEEALAAVQKVATGQAEAYANTTGGKLLSAQIRMGEQMERLGTEIMPMVADATLAAADAVETLAPIFGTVGESIDNLSQGLGFFSGAVVDAADAINPFSSGTHNANENFRRMSGSLSEMSAKLPGVGEDFALLGADAVNMGELVATANKRISDTFDTMRSDIEAAAGGVADAMYDPILAKAELATLELEAKRQRNLRDAAEAGSIERTEAQNTLDETNKKKIAVLATLASYGDQSAKTTLIAMGQAAIATGRLTAEQLADWNALIAKLKQVQAQAYATSAALRGGGGGGKQARASGGPVYPGQTYTVGEEGPETLMMTGSGGYVLPNAGGGGGGSRAKQPLIVLLNVNGRQFAKATVDDIDRALFDRARSEQAI